MGGLICDDLKGNLLVDATAISVELMLLLFHCLYMH